MDKRIKQKLCLGGITVLVLMLTMSFNVTAKKICKKNIVNFEEEGLSDEELYGNGEYSIFSDHKGKNEKKEQEKKVNPNNLVQPKASVSTKEVKQLEETQSNLIPKQGYEENKTNENDNKQIEENENKKEKCEEKNSEPKVIIEGAQQEGYYNQDVNLKVRVEDTEYDKRDTSVTTTFTDLNGIYQKEPVTFKQNSKISEDFYVLREEGMYEVEVEVLQEEKVIKEESRKFYIDKTPPEIVLEEVENKTIPEINIIELKEKCVKDKSPVESNIYVNGMEETDNVTKEGDYQLTLKATDQAQNQTTKSAFVTVVPEITEDISATSNAMEKELKPAGKKK